MNKYGPQVFGQNPKTALIPSLPEVERLVQQALHEKLFSAASCVASLHGELRHTSYQGFLHMPPPLKRMTLNAKFDLGALTSSLATAVAILFLVGKNRIDLGMPLQRAWPLAKNTAWADIRLDTLLDHTSGIEAPENWDPLAPLWDTQPAASANAPMLATANVQEALWTQIHTHLLPNPKVRHAVYSPYNSLVLGWVLESILQKPLDRWLAREIYTPMRVGEMMHFQTPNNPSKMPVMPFVTSGHCSVRKRDIQAEPLDRVAHALGGVAGHQGLFSHVGGVWRLAEGLRKALQGDDKLLHAGTIQRLWTPTMRAGQNPFTLGWEKMTRHSTLGQGRWHPSSVGQVDVTMGTAYLIDPTHGHVCVVLTNAALGSGGPQPKRWLKFCQQMMDLLITRSGT